MSPTRVWLLRHAESADPTVFHGAESDVDLSPRGERQAAAVAGYLAGHQPDLVVSSAMRRAQRTAAAIARQAGIPHQIEPDLHERRVSSLSRTPIDDPRGIWPDTLRRWINGEIDYAHPGAESFTAIRDRVLPAWDRLITQHSSQAIVVVAHGIVCKVLVLSLVNGWTVANWHEVGKVANTAICELEQTAIGWRAPHGFVVPVEVT